MSKTFAELGIPFPLFSAPTDEASEYCGLRSCSLCGVRNQHCFLLGIGCSIIRHCSACGAESGLDADDRANCRCRRCESIIPFPNFEEREIAACYTCLRSGNAAITKDTEIGMISWEQAFEGVTHGNQELCRDDFEMVPKEDGWTGARLPQEMIFELLRTPTYNTIQGDRWQFCCRQPMVFVGPWSREEFSRRADDGDGRQLFEAIVQDSMAGLWEDDLGDETGVYVFRCGLCQAHRAHWDLA